MIIILEYLEMPPTQTGHYCQRDCSVNGHPYGGNSDTRHAHLATTLKAHAKKLIMMLRIHADACSVGVQRYNLSMFKGT